ncbi:MAG: hypothetical protein Q4E56_02510 [Pseudomonadota bacterium]|nr:hypothetical protein [Pseudomonadota bacterium]
MKKATTKKVQSKKSVASAPVCTVPASRKVWGVIALAGLFACGYILGGIMATPDKAQQAAECTTASEMTVVENPAPIATCTRIEQLLEQQLTPEDSQGYEKHMYNAETYNRLADNGCAEHSDKYRAMAVRETQIAVALMPVENMSEYEVEDIVDTYKKAKMQAAAQQVIDKLQQASEPAIDFILKLENILED